MEEPRKRYILVQDRVGQILERNMLAFGLATKSTPTQVLKGELLEALPESEQPGDSTRIALGGIDRKLRLECSTEDVMRLTTEEADLLLPVSSAGLRYQTFIDRKSLDFGKQLGAGSKVLVSLKGFSKNLPGVVWYKGELPNTTGTMFGVELHKNPSCGTSDGTFRNRRYFHCAPDSGVFVGLDKLIPLEDSDFKSSPKSPKRDEHLTLTSRLKDTVIPSFFKGKHNSKSPQERSVVALEIDQRIVTFLRNIPIRGTVRYIGDEREPSGRVHTVVGVELDERSGNGTGKLKGKQLFVCRRDYALFVDIETVILEKDFDENLEGASTKTTLHIQGEGHTKGKAQEESKKQEMLAKSMGYGHTKNLDKQSVGNVRRANSIDSDVIIAAGESSKTDPTEFIAKQRQMFDEFKSSKLSASNGDVMMHDDERTDSASSNLNFDDKHFRNTPPNSEPITEQPGPSNAYDDFVIVENREHLAKKHRSSEPVMHPDLEKDRHTRTIVVAEVVMSNVSSGTNDKADVDNNLSKDPSVNHEIHNSAQQIEESQGDVAGVEDQKAFEVPHSYEVGTMVEVPVAEGVPRYGVIRWIGYLPQMKEKLVAGLELEEEQSACSDGTFNGTRYFTCPAGRGFFTLLRHCREDSRFTPNSPINDSSQSGKAFGSLPSPVVQGITVPPHSLEDKYCGNMRGLQGHHNSCYLDATLYSMFAFSCVFDTLLHRERKVTDLQEYNEVQCVLRESIVNPLRVHGFVRADRVLQLRELLDKLSSTAGLVNEEKDPEEFLNSLLQQVLKADPFLHVKSRDLHEKDSEGAYFYQIITEKDDSLKIAQVQTLLEQSFISADIILAEVPSCLILQMPRFGSRYKMYDMILPNLELDVSSIVESVPRKCTMCGHNVAQFECNSCYQEGMFGKDSGIVSYCSTCNDRMHSNPKREEHKLKPVLLPRKYDSKIVDKTEKQKMELFAVVCIETSHYVAFVKCGTKANSPWCFFDSMADRKGEKDGYNIPAVTRCPEALEWLSKDPKDIVAAKERGEVPEKVRRLLGDGYLCMYQNLDMTMYK